MLIWAAVDKHPYSFYTLLRVICCAVFAYSAVFAHGKDRIAWAWIFGVLAVVYNPLLRIHLDRDTWIYVNWISVGVVVIAFASFWRNATLRD